MNNYYNPYVQNPYMQNNFDFNGKWVNSIDDVPKIQNQNLPVISMDRTQNRFYMMANNQLKAYEYKEIEIMTPDKEIESLKTQISQLNNSIEKLLNQSNTNTRADNNNSQTAQNNQNKKEGINNAKQSI